MKKISLLCLAFALVLTGCTKDNVRVISNAKTIKVSVNANPDISKTVLIENVDSYSFEWCAGDSIRVIEGLPYMYEKSSAQFDEYESKPLAAGGASAEFEVTLGERDLSEAYGRIEYLAHYPIINIWGTTAAYDDNDNMYILMEFPSYQMPSATCFDPGADVMISKLVVADKRPDKLDFEMGRVGSIIKMTLTGLNPGEKVSDVSLDLNYICAGYFHYYAASGYVKPVDAGFFLYAYYPDEAPLVADANGNAVVWLRCFAGASDRISVVVETDKGTYEKSVDLTGDAMPFIQSGLTKFSIDLSGHMTAGHS